MEDEAIPENSIAIIGLSGRFPGADTPKDFWNSLCRGIDSLTSFSTDQLKQAGVADEKIHSSAYVKRRGILSHIESFDADFFGFSGLEAQVTDPQHRLFLECAWEALEDGGYRTEDYKGSIGVYGGTGMSSYFLHHIHPNDEIKETAGDFLIQLGNERDYLTTRVSYKLDLTGPSLAVQTSSSTSLTAVCIACNHLLTYQCDMALAGGVYIAVPQMEGYQHREGMIFSPDGLCRPFDAKAAGTVPGNGVGLVLLKRLEEAIADRDHIYAVIRGYGLNNDGQNKVGFSAPSVHGQAKAINMALEMANVNPESLAFIEAHGTGTPMGDPIEIEALTRAYHQHTNKTQYCALGSVKANIGHTMDAAGVTGLIKAALSLHHRTLPPSIHFETPNPHINFDATPFYINKNLKKWDNSHPLLRGAVSSFGMGGTNAHLILEEGSPVHREIQERPQILILSAKTTTALEKMKVKLADFLSHHPSIPLQDVAYTLQVGRKTFEHKTFVVASTVHEAIHALSGRAIDAREYASLKEIARQWLEGKPVDWKKHHQGHNPHRVSLPTYPFERKRYWIDPPTKQMKPVEKRKVIQGSMRDILHSIWCECLGLEKIDPNDQFFDLGGDSLIAVQIIAKIKEMLHIPLSIQSILEYPTLALLAKKIEESNKQNESSLIVKLKKGKASHSLFCIHPIGGQVFCYQHLAESLDYPGSIYGIQAPNEPLDSIEAMASHYLAAIRAIQPEGPYHLLGASFGGLVAYEMAAQLDKSNQKTGILVLLDIVHPKTLMADVKEELDLIALLIDLFEGKSIQTETLRLLSSQGRQDRLMQSMGLEAVPSEEQTKVFNYVTRHLKALSQYSPPRLSKKLLYFQAAERASATKEISLGETWRNLVDEITIHEIPGNHISMIFRPHVGKLSTILNTHLKENHE